MSADIYIDSSYPEYVKRVLRDDILKREPTDNVRIAYELAERIHHNEIRKGLNGLDYITHSLRTYDLVNRSVSRGGKDREAMLAASLLHDCIENYRPECLDVMAVRSRDDVRAEVTEKIRSAFPDEQFANRVVGLVEEVTNPLEYKDADGNKITKKDWQVEHVKHISVLARVIKICDQTANLISNIEEVPNWDYERLTEYKDKSDAVVAAAQENISEAEKRYFSPFFATRFYELIAKYTQDILDDMKNDGKQIPPQRQYASINIGGIQSEIERDTAKLDKKTMCERIDAVIERILKLGSRNHVEKGR